MTEQPWDYPTAVERCRSASLRQEASEQALVEAGRTFAITEERYRLSLAQEIVRQHSDGVAWTVCDDISRGQPEVARLRRERDIAEGVREAMTHACWRRNADRRDAQRFADWSQRREFAEAGGQVPHESGETFGSRRAA